MRRPMATSGILVTIFMTFPLMAYGHGGDTNLVHSCVRTATGAVRLIGPNGTCNANETARDWPTDAAFLALQGQVSTLQAQNVGQDAAITALQGQVAELQAENANQSAEISSLRDRIVNLEDSQADISVRVFNSMSLSIPSDIETTLTFDSEQWDTDSMHSMITNTDRLTATTAGKYYIFGHVNFDHSPFGGERRLRIYLNGTDNGIAHVSVPPVTHGGRAAGLSISTHFDLAAGDFVVLRVSQDSGAPLNINVSVNESPQFGMVKVP